MLLDNEVSEMLENINSKIREGKIDLAAAYVLLEAHLQDMLRNSHD